MSSMDVVDMYEDYGFLGNEFLTWMWFKMETQPEEFNCIPGSKIVLTKEKESVTIKGEESDLIIGKIALLDGFIVTEMNLHIESYSFTIKGSDMSFNGLKMPKVEKDGSENEEEGIILEKIYLIQDVSEKLDTLFKEFIQLRVDNWPETLTKIKYWINEG